MAEPVSATSSDRLDERLIAQGRGPAAMLLAFWSRLKGGDLGSLPVVFGLVAISVVFYLKEPIFLSSRNLVTITQFAAPIGIISLGIVLVLLLGEIDLSVGSVSGASAAVMAVQVVNSGRPLILGILAGVLVGVAVGLVYAFLYTKLGVPSFVFSLAGLLAFQGVLLYVLGSDGTINLPADSWLLEFARFKFLTGTASYVLVALIGLAFLAAQLWGRRTRVLAELSAPSTASILIRAGLLT
ncbi:MAG: sugar ABC transporter permease, partial [Nocardioides sp.]